MAVVCIDNHVLIWGIRQQASATQQEMIGRTTQLLETLDSSRTKVIVPTPVVAEFLTGTDEQEFTAVLEILQTRFLIANFDALAALATARIRKRNRQSGLETAIRQEVQGVRPQIAIDHMIIGIAIANRADILYTEDGTLRRFAEPHMNVRDIPPALERQIPFPEE